MSETENKALVRRMIGAWNDGDLNEMQKYWAPDMVHYSRGTALDAQTVVGMMGSVMQAFPDLRMTIEEMIAEGDLVSSLLTLSGTHTGEFLGIPATGRQVSVSLQGLVRVVDGKVTEHWGVADGIALLEQLNLIPQEFLAATG